MLFEISFSVIKEITLKEKYVFSLPWHSTTGSPSSYSELLRIRQYVHVVRWVKYMGLHGNTETVTL